MVRLALFLMIVLAAGGSAPPARALESAWVSGAQADVRLLADHAANASIRAGVEIQLKPGWKTYWRYPGDAGVPPRFDWSGSENLAAAEVKWPTPMRFVDESGSKSIGYHGEVVFPVAIRAADPARPVKLKLKLDFAVCEKLCVPADAELTLEIPATAIAPLERLDRAGQSLPRRAALGENVAGLAVTKVSIERGTTPRAIVEVAAGGEALDLFAEGPDDRWALPLPDRIESKDGKARFAFAIDGVPPGGPPIPSKLVLTLVAGGKAIEVEAPLD
ncbi:MAG TPA: protein-disulfide reductase DsbD domain-containing protein [Xanthobacteraceae bacterium]|nr:protein-disulfide reductase DsbD domain-containing protein [Xanthobacteraceae bacterium]